MFGGGGRVPLEPTVEQIRFPSFLNINTRDRHKHTQARSPPALFLFLSSHVCTYSVHVHACTERTWERESERRLSPPGRTAPRVEACVLPHHPAPLNTHTVRPHVRAGLTFKKNPINSVEGENQARLDHHPVFCSCLPSANFSPSLPAGPGAGTGRLCQLSRQTCKVRVLKKTSRTRGL